MAPLSKIALAFIGVCLGFKGAGAQPTLALEAFARGLKAPVGMETAPGDGERLFIVEQGGLIRILRNGAPAPVAFLNIADRVESGGEKGLLGLAFHPDFKANGKFYAHYTRRLKGQLQSVISEFRVSPASPERADPAGERVLFTVEQPYDNHNGGQISFGPDGLLYIALGDGGSGGDPQNNGQNLNTPLGKILRVGVNPPFAPGKQYAIPADNPFAAGGALPEIWAYGLRNPWRFSFDRVTGELFTGDVGQNKWEEVNIVTKGGNYGWRRMEGAHCFPPSMGSCKAAGFIPPIGEYDHGREGGTSITGGYVYRGTRIPALTGTYVFGDLSSGRVWGLSREGNGAWRRRLLLTHRHTVSSFGQDAAGELYLLDYDGGAIYRIAGN